MEKGMIFFVDFDGTITEGDVCEAMVRQFAKPGWEELNQLWEEGTLSTVACAQETLALMTMTHKDLLELAAQQILDPMFIEFVTWTKKQGYPIYILSDGYENYISPILSRSALQLPTYANKLDYYQDGWKIEAPYYNERCGRCGVCKSKLILDLMDTTSTRVYIGDGYSDRCPVYLADLVFAKKSLADYCQQKGIPFYNYRDFGDILAHLQTKEEI